MTLKLFDNVNWLTLIQVLPTICFSYIMRDVSANFLSLRRFGIFFFAKTSAAMFLPKRPEFNRSKERDRKSELVLRSTYQIFE